MSSFKVSVGTWTTIYWRGQENGQVHYWETLLLFLFFVNLYKIFKVKY